MVTSFGKAGAGAMGHSLRRVLAAMLLLIVAACTATYEIHGYVPSDDELSFIKVGKDTRESVENMIGKPSASGLLNDVGWYYVQSNWKSYGIRQPQEVSREVLAITFTPEGVVENIELFGLEKGNIVTISRRVTSSNIKGSSFVRQLFGNVGGLNASQIIQ
jgi:outer membrane protein assembly factor BamE (lipoprotein component of BamABCDE complex)